MFALNSLELEYGRHGQFWTSHWANGGGDRWMRNSAGAGKEASTVIVPWQPFLASPVVNVRLYHFFGTVLRTCAIAVSLPPTNSIAASPVGTLKCFESMYFTGLSDSTIHPGIGEYKSWRLGRTRTPVEKFLKK